MPEITPKDVPQSKAPVSGVVASRQINTNVEAHGGVTNVEAHGGVTTKEEPAVVEESISPKFAALARKEKQLRVEAQRLKVEREAQEAKAKEYETNYIPKSQLKTAALAALKSGELSYDEFTQMMLDQPQVNPEIEALKAELAELKTLTQKTSTRFDEKQTAEYNQAVNQIRNDVKQLVDTDPYYETLKAYDMVDDVVKHIEDYFKEHGTVLSVEEAAKTIEDQTFQEAEKLLNLTKFKQKLNPVAPETQKPDHSNKKQIQTLSHAVTASAKPMSARERAIAAFRGQQK